ncbi:hypothetical protein ACHAXT_002094 [Thalassiosira profunda]
MVHKKEEPSVGSGEICNAAGAGDLDATTRWSSTAGESSSGQSSSDGSAAEEGQAKVVIDERKDEPGGGRRARRRERAKLENAARYRSKAVFIAISVVPLLAASIALAFVLKSEMGAPSKPGDESALVDVVGTAPTPASSEVSVPTLQPVPASTPSINEHNGQEPNEPPADASNASSHVDFRPEWIAIESPTPPTVGPSYNPTTSAPTESPTLSNEPTTAAPTMCAASGEMCPAGGKDTCCSGKCQKDKETKVEVCK